MAGLASAPRPPLSRSPSVASTSSSRSSNKPPPPPKPSHLSVAITGTLNSDALRQYVRAQSTGGSFSSQQSFGSPRSNHDDDDEDEGNEEWGTAKPFQAPSAPRHTSSGKTPLRDIWGSATEVPKTSEPETFEDVEEARIEEPAEEPSGAHSRYVSSASTIKASRQNRRLISRTSQVDEAEGDEEAFDPETQKNGVHAVAEDVEEAHPSVPQSQPTAALATSTSAAAASPPHHQDGFPEALGHHSRGDTSIATVRPLVPTDLPVHQPYDSNSEDHRSPIPGLPRYSTASSYGIPANDGERSREPSIMSARGSTTFVKWDMHYADSRAHTVFHMNHAHSETTAQQDTVPKAGADPEDSLGTVPSERKADATPAHEPEAAALPTPPVAAPTAKAAENASVEQLPNHASEDATSTSVTSRPKMARALYAIHGESAFNELSLAAGQSFEIINEELQGGWCLALVRDDSADSGWRRGLVPRGWYAVEREMAPPPPPQPSEAEVLERKKTQDEVYLAPVTVKASTIHAEAEKQPPLLMEDAEVESQPSANPSPLSTLQARTPLSAVPSVSQFLNHGSTSKDQAAWETTGLDLAAKSGTTKSKRQTRATAALSQLMSPTSSQGSTFAAGSGPSAGSSKLVTPPGASRIQKRPNAALSSISPDSSTSPAASGTPSRLPTQPTSRAPLLAGISDDTEYSIESNSQPAPASPSLPAQASPPSSDLCPVVVSAETPSTDTHAAALAHSQILPFSRRLNRFSPFVTSGAESYLLSRDVEHVPAKGGADRGLQQTPGAPVAPVSDTHEIFTETNGELRWKAELNPFWTEIHDPAYVEVNAGKGWLRLSAEGVVVFQVTTRTVDGDLTTYRTSDRYDAGSEPTQPGSKSSPQHLPPLDPVLPPSGSSSAQTVPRRYKHFVQLAEHLELKYPLLAVTTIPPLPGKSHSRRFDAEFIELRRKELSNWLERVVRHPILRKDEVLIAFLMAGSTPNEALQDGEEDGYQPFEQWLAAHQQSGKARHGEQTQIMRPSAAFFARTFHPEFAVDQDEFDAEGKRCEAWFRSVEGQVTGSGAAKKNPEPLLGAFKGMREDLVTTSESYRLFARSLLRLTTGVSETTDDLKAHDHATGARSAVRNDAGVWCWREGCQECAALTHSLQATSDTLQEVADLHEQQARYHLFPIHERIWNVSRPHSTNQALFETHHATLAKYALARAADSSALAHETTAGTPAPTASGSLPVEVAEHLAGKAETVLNVTMAEIDHQHASKVSDWTKIGKGFLDEQIGFYEEVLAKLYEARRTYSPSEWRRVAESSSTSAAPRHEEGLNQENTASWGLNPSPYLSELRTARAAPPPPLTYPSTQLLRPGAVESALLRPVGLAGEVLVGMLGGKGGRADARRAFSNAGSASGGATQSQSQPGSGHFMGRSFSSGSGAPLRPGT